MNPYSLSYVLNLWQKAKDSQQMSAHGKKALSIALRQYVIPELDPDTDSLTTRQFDAYCQTFTADKLKDALEIFDQKTQKEIELEQLSPRTRDNYRSALKRFICWIKRQVWWHELFPEPMADVAPFRPKFDPKATKGKYPSYQLKVEDWPNSARIELEAFQQFRLSGGKSLRRMRRQQRRGQDGIRCITPKIDAVKPSTVKKEEQAICRFFGWYIQEHSSDELHLSLLTDVELLDDYTYWAMEHRGVCYSTGVHIMKTAIAIAKWLNFDQSNRRDWSDIPLILELQDLQSEYAENYQQQKKQLETKQWSDKKLTHEQARKVVRYLRSLCSPNYGKHDLKTGEFRSHGIRPLSAVARAWQTYLIVKILVYCPVRQEEIRNFQLGETLFRHVDQQNNPYYVVQLQEHKRSHLGKERHYRLPAILTEDLDLWVYKWRPLISESVQTVEKWMEFWGYPSDKVERLQNRIQEAKLGKVSEKVKVPLEEYIRREEKKLQGPINRRAAWPKAKENISNHNYLFFLLGKGHPESFGTPHYVASIWRRVNRAIAMATTALFGETKWTNPHALRHIAEKHIRAHGKSHIAESFGTLIGHSKEIGDDYAAQITSSYELTEAIVDDWWE